MSQTVPTVVLTVIGLVFAVFYGAKACPIFVTDETGKPTDVSATSTSWKIHQFWFNFLGCLYGWAALWVVLERHGWFLSAPPGNIDISDGVLLVTAFIGMTGHLPRSMMGIVAALGDVAMRLIGFAAKDKP